LEETFARNFDFDFFLTQGGKVILPEQVHQGSIDHVFPLLLGGSKFVLKENLLASFLCKVHSSEETSIVNFAVVVGWVADTFAQIGRKLTAARSIYYFAYMFEDRLIWVYLVRRKASYGSLLLV
jgi:hypothetical protein